MARSRQDRHPRISISSDDFHALGISGWSNPVFIVQDTLAIAKRIPSGKFVAALGSGSVVEPRPASGSAYYYPSAIGGVDVYRYDSRDASQGFPYNRDHYILTPAPNGSIHINGPYGPGESWHWLPELLSGIT